MKKVHFMIHDLNTWGGQDRSTLEVINQMDPANSVELHCYTIQGLNRPETSKSIIKPLIRRPVFLKAVYYHLLTCFKAMGNLAKGEEIISTGTCSIVSNRFQIQFVHHAWNDVMNRYPELRQKASWYKVLYNKVWLRFNLLLEKLLYHNNRKYLALSHQVKADLMRFFGIDSSRIAVIPHGIDSGLFKPLESGAKAEAKRNYLLSKKIDQDKKIILFVGEYRRKGLDNAILAFSQVSPEVRKNWVLLAVGLGDIAHFHQLARNSGVESQVILETHHKNILPFYQFSDLFLLPTHYEPFGLVTIEAFSCALPSIVSCSSGAYELAKEGESAIGIRDPNNVSEICSHLELLLKDEQQRIRIGNAARKVAEGRSWKVVAREYEQWLNR